MALTWVMVVRSDGDGVGDAVYIDANYVDAAGSIGTPLKTDTGQHTFETFDDNGEPNWALIETVGCPPGNNQSNPVVVTLEPVLDPIG